jgi:hypothetical protein
MIFQVSTLGVASGERGGPAAVFYDHPVYFPHETDNKVARRPYSPAESGDYINLKTAVELEMCRLDRGSYGSDGIHLKGDR